MFPSRPFLALITLMLVLASCIKDVSVKNDVVTDNPSDSTQAPVDTVAGCNLAPVAITKFENTETAIRIFWEPSTAARFERYEIYRIKFMDRTFQPDMEKIQVKVASITDKNTSSFLDTSVMVLGRYYYRIRVVSGSECAVYGEVHQRDAGIYVEFDYTPTFDNTHNLIYGFKERVTDHQDYSKDFAVVDPKTLTILHQITLNQYFRSFFLSDDGNELLLLEKPLTPLYKVYRVDPKDFTLILQDTFTLPNVSSGVDLIQNNRVFYKTGNFPDQRLMQLDLTTRDTVQILRAPFITKIMAVNEPQDGITTFLAFSSDRLTENFTVFHNTVAGVEVVKQVTNVTSFDENNGGNYGLGTGVYNADYDLMRSYSVYDLVTSPQTNPYYATFNNEIFRYSDGTRVTKYAETGLGNGAHFVQPLVFFPDAEPEELYIWTEESKEGLGYMPTSRLYRFPFQKQ